jgi:DNA-directed RNA polymerase subunit RPC12/RpoP
MAIPRKTRDALFIDENTLRLNCGKCGREVLVRLAVLAGQRTVDCEECSAVRGSAT